MSWKTRNNVELWFIHMLMKNQDDLIADSKRKTSHNFPSKLFHCTCSAINRTKWMILTRHGQKVHAFTPSMPYDMAEDDMSTLWLRECRQTMLNKNLKWLTHISTHNAPALKPKNRLFPLRVCSPLLLHRVHRNRFYFFGGFVLCSNAWLVNATIWTIQTTISCTQKLHDARSHIKVEQ